MLPLRETAGVSDVATLGARPRAPRAGALAARSPTFLYRRARPVSLLLLAPPLLWLGVVYLGSLLALLGRASSPSTTSPAGRPSSRSRTYAALLTSRANLDIILRTLGMAAAVTVGRGADRASRSPTTWRATRPGAPRRFLPRGHAAAVVELPRRVYAWNLILAKDGIVSWSFAEARAVAGADGVLALPGGRRPLALDLATSAGSWSSSTSGCRS